MCPLPKGGASGSTVSPPPPPVKRVRIREANFSGFWFIAINDKFGPIYRDKFDKIRKNGITNRTLGTGEMNVFRLQNATWKYSKMWPYLQNAINPFSNGKKNQESLEIHDFTWNGIETSEFAYWRFLWLWIGNVFARLCMYLAKSKLWASM